MIRIVTDSAADIHRKEAREIGVDVVVMKVHFEGFDYSWEADPTFENFYANLKNAKKLPTTSQSSPDEYAAIYRDAAEKGDDVVVIALSSGLSGQCQSAVLAKNLIPAAKVYIVDSKSAILGQRLLVHQAVAMRKSGSTAKEIADALESLVGRLRVAGLLDTLTYLSKGGRMPKAAAVAGNLLSIKPMVKVIDGVLQMAGKARNLQGFFRFFEEWPAHDADYPFYVGYALRDQSAHMLKEMIQEKCEIPVEGIFPVGSIIGAHVGPGAVAFAYIAKD